MNFRFYLFTDNGPVHFNLPVPKYVAATSGAAGADDAVAPMTGTVTQVVVTPGTEVKQGDLLMTMVAMKMEHAIKAPKDGVIKSVLANEGEVKNHKSLIKSYAGLWSLQIPLASLGVKVTFLDKIIF